MVFANKNKSKKHLNIGTYKEEKYAAIAYDIFAKQLFDIFANLNEPNATENEIQHVKNMFTSCTIKKLNEYA